MARIHLAGPADTVRIYLKYLILKYCQKHPIREPSPYSFALQDEEKTPEGAVTLEQYLLGSVENKPKTLQAFIDQGGNANSVDEVCKIILFDPL